MPVSIKARCFNGKAYDLTLDGPAPSVSDLQESISNASGITPDRQTILYKGQVLGSGSSLSDYSVADGSTISVVRRIGKSSSTSSSSSTKPTSTSSGKQTSTLTASKQTSTPSVATSPVTDMPTSTDVDADGAPQPPSLEEMMRSLNMGGGAAGGAGGGSIPGLASMLGGDASGMGSPANMEQLFAQLPQMMNGLLSTPLFKEYLNNSEKQEQSREAILSNPMMRSLLENDPEFASVVNDPEKWRASMEAAKSLLPEDEEADANADADAGSGAAATSTREATPSVSRGVAEGKSKAAATAASRLSAAELAPPGIEIGKLSESYGHALGQSLINSGLGLNPDLVVKGLKSAVDNKAFPMALPQYEREMATLQNIASDFLKKANLEDANNFFEEIRQEGTAIILEEGKIAYEKSEVEANVGAAVAEEKATVLVIVSARLLDGRHFFTCPAADDKGDSVHPLTLPLETAPRALAKGIVGMKENESRLLYVHPSACEGMTEMFGDLLPPNALLIFDLQLVSANAPEEEAVGESYFSSG